MSAANVEAFATPGITPPAAFDRLRRDLHAAADPDRIAASRTRDTVSQLRTRADYLSLALDVYAGTGLGLWYAELATRLNQLATEIEAEAKANGVLS